ncbi:MAG: peroxidase [Solirubrobacterales bacterium]|nr:peroxidase [Solirubrobacterales bacterium]
MTFIETVAPDEAAGPAAEIYAADREAFGRLPNFTRAFSLLPEVYAAWKGLNGAIKATMELRRYELATVAAARRLRSSYCALAHGSILADRFLGADAVRAAVADPRAAGLDDADVAVMELADKVVADATTVTQADVDRLRASGLTDGEILEVILAAAARCFFSKVLDATGALPDSAYAELDPALRDALTVGRPIASS